jgi:glycine C-acetyltransferase
LGPTGAGAGEEQGVMGEIDVYFSTFAKSMASIGAFFAGDKDVMDYMKYNMRSQMFAKSLPMPIVIGALKRLDMVRTMPELRSNLWRNVSQLQSGLKEAGFDIGTTNSCVTPVYMKGGVGEAMALTYDLRENYNIFCSIVVYPVVPKGTIILRLIPTSVHTPTDIKETITAFKAVQQGLQSGAYKAAAEQYMSTVAER